MTAPDHMPEMFENRLHEPGHPHMEPPANPVRFSCTSQELHHDCEFYLVVMLILGQIA